MDSVLSLTALFEDPGHGGLRVVAGASRERSFTDVVVVTREEQLPEHVENQLAVLLQEIPTSQWRVEALMRRVHDRGFTGLALAEPVMAGAAVEALARRLDIVVLSADRSADLARTVWRLLEGRDTLALSYVRRVARSIEYRAESLPDLLEHLSRSVGHPVTLIDAEGTLHTVGPAPAPEILAAIRPDGRLQNIRSAQGCAVVVPVAASSRPGLRLVIHGRSLADVQMRALSIAAEIAMPAIAARLLIDEVVSVSDVARSETLLVNLLESGGQIDPALEGLLAERGWRTGGWHLGLYITARERWDVIDLLRATTRELAGLSPAVHTVAHQGAVAAWISWSTQPEPEAVDTAVAKLRQAHRRIGAVVPVATGIGRLGRGATGLIGGLDEARDAARLAARRPSSGWWVRVDRLGHEQLLAAWTNPETFVPAARTLLEPLSDGELHTLSTYLDNESSLVATATALQVHRNTIGPRVHRIQERLGLDLDDPDVRLALHLACRAVSGQ